MPVFRDTDHLYQVLGALFEQVAADNEIAERLLKGNLIVRFRFKDPVGSVTIDLRRPPITYTFGEYDLKPDVEMIQSGVEVVDPRTLLPCDWATVVRSVMKTGRLVVAEPGVLTHTPGKGCHSSPF